MVNPGIPDGSVTPGTPVIFQVIGLASRKSVSEQLTVTAESVSVDAGASTVISEKEVKVSSQLTQLAIIHFYSF